MFTGITLTNKGAEMLAAAQNGALLNFTRVQIGQGSLASGAAEEAATSLVSPVKYLPIADYKNKGTNVIVTFQITNADVTAAFTFSELGLFAESDDGIEHLYAYSNAGANAEIIPLPSETTVDYIMSLNLTVNSAENVTVVIDDALVYVTEKRLVEAIAENAYVHPEHTARSSGLYKVEIDDEGHVVSVAAVKKEDITALGIPAQDTTYSEATTSSPGLMSAWDKTVVGRAIQDIGDTMKGNLKFASCGVTFAGTESDMYHTRIFRGTAADGLWFEMDNTSGVMRRYILKCPPSSLEADENRYIATIDDVEEAVQNVNVAVDGEVTEDGTNAVSGAAVFSHVQSQIANIDVPEIVVDQTVTADSTNPASGAAVAAYAMAKTAIVATTTDPGAGTAVAYPQGTVVLVYE